MKRILMGIFWYLVILYTSIFILHLCFHSSTTAVPGERIPYANYPFMFISLILAIWGTISGKLPGTKNKIEENKSQQSGSAKASHILGIVSFIPLVGVLLGIIAIILGIESLLEIKKDRLEGRELAISGIKLGVLGIAFTFLIYGSLFYFGFVSKSGPFIPLKAKASKMILTQDAGLLELYKKKHGNYPKTLDEMNKVGYQVFLSDDYLRPFYYKVSEDGQSYDLRSLGPDGIYGSKDNILVDK